MEHQGSFVVITDDRVSNSNDLNEMVLLYLRRRLKSIIVDGKKHWLGPYTLFHISYGRGKLFNRDLNLLTWFYISDQNKNAWRPIQYAVIFW